MSGHVNKNKIFCVAAALAFMCGLVSQATILTNNAMAEGPVLAATTDVQVSTFEELLAAFDSTWEGESGSINITLAGDIEQTYGGDDYMGVNAGWTVNLDLAGHTLVLRNDGPRGLKNNGTLIVSGNGVITDATTEEMNEAWGLIDNYGTMTVKSGTFIDRGQGGGSTIKNRPGGTLTIESADMYMYATAGGNACVYSDGVLTIYDGVTMENYSTDETHSDSTGSWYGTYALIIGGGTATIGTTAGNIVNPVTIYGNRGALSINSGTVLINNGVYTASLYYGAWITNNGDVSDVTIKYAEMTGNRYGVYSSVDDGKQDLSDVSIRIEDGKYVGSTKAAVAVNQSHSENSFGMSISGGKFSSSPNETYIAESHEVFEIDEENYHYMVDVPEVINLPESVYLAVGETYDFSSLINDSAKRHTTFTTSGSVTLEDFVVTATAAGNGTLTFVASNFGGEMPIIVYNAEAADDDESQSETEAEAIAEYATQKIAELIESGEDANEALVLGTAEIDGVEYTGVDLVKKVLSDGYKLETKMTTATLDSEDWEQAEAYEEILSELGDEEAVAAVYDGVVAVVAAKDGEQIPVGMLLELGDSTSMVLEIPEEYLQVPDGVKRIFYVVRGHKAVDGTKNAEHLDATQIGKYLYTETDKFSTFAITYVDTDEETGIIIPNTGIFTRDAGFNATIAMEENYLGVICAVVVTILIGLIGAVKITRNRR
ncbi:hypothetical protein IJG93_03475 [Candidatus Saccharibacteria bacterium]|nr:hypothetical protein [Candidatus Saccharibacteria bacterium]